MVDFDAIDEKIIRTLYDSGIPMTIGEISRTTHISWITVKKHIEKFAGLGLIKKKPDENRKHPKIRWNFDDYGLDELDDFEITEEDMA